MNTTATEVMDRIASEAEKSAPSLRVIDSMKVGEVIRQGDLYVERIGRLPKNRGKATTNAQLAVGATQGSRHVISPVPKTLKIFAPPEGADALVGPTLATRERFLLTHPEHGHFDLPAGRYQVRYQRDYSRERAQEIRRVAD